MYDVDVRRHTQVTRQGGPVTFAIGLAAGVLGGFMLGVLFGKYVVQLVSLLYQVVDRRGDDGDRLKFELLLQ